MRVSYKIVKARSPSMLFIASQCLPGSHKNDKSPKVHSAAEPEEEETQQ